MKISIYAAYHKHAPRLQGAGLVPVHVGRATSGPLLDMIGDDTGDNISERNDAWCELTAVYWAWKNDLTSDYIGLVHYRRVLDVTGRARSGPAEHYVQHFDVEAWGRDVEAWQARSLDQCDIIVPREHTMGRSVQDNYLAGHAAQDWRILRDVIGRDYPDYLASFEAVSSGLKIRLGNIAVMSRPLFERYCAWLFDVLLQVEAADVDRTNYSVYQGRYLGFLGERLMSVFIHHLRANEPDIRIKEVALLNLSRALVTPYLGPQDVPPEGTVNIALSADRLYLPHAAALLRSVMDHADPARPINVFFLHSGLEPADLNLLDTLLKERPLTQFHPLETGGQFDGSYRSRTRAPSNATYNRFLLFSLLPGLDRVLYLDADLIVKADICALYDTEMGGAQVAAVPDWIMTRTLSGPVPTLDPNVPDLQTYHRSVLGLTDAQIAKYFNAGVLLFNFAAMDDPVTIGKLLSDEARNGKYLFRDQDILNRTFKDSYLPLDGRWNVFNATDAAYQNVPKVNRIKAMDARGEPWIVHYADQANKPWLGRAVPHAEAYWRALIRTPFYGEVIGHMQGVPLSTGRSRRGIAVRMGMALADRFPTLRAPLLLLYARVRNGR